jgi:hypothetical protein
MLSIELMNVPAVFMHDTVSFNTYKEQRQSAIKGKVTSIVVSSGAGVPNSNSKSGLIICCQLQDTI